MNIKLLFNFLNAKKSTHTLAIVGVILYVMIKHFVDDPNAVRWLDAHWAWKNLVEGVPTALTLLVSYLNPTSNNIKGELSNDISTTSGQHS